MNFDPECPTCASPARCLVHDPLRPEDETYIVPAPQPEEEKDERND